MLLKDKNAKENEKRRREIKVKSKKTTMKNKRKK